MTIKANVVQSGLHKGARKCSFICFFANAIKMLLSLMRLAAFYIIFFGWLFSGFLGYAKAQDNAHKWNHHDIYSAGVDLPGFFTSQPTIDEYHTYDFKNSISNKIFLSISCLIADAKFTPSPLQEYHDDDTHYFNVITYDLMKGNYFVISGIDKKGNILYIKGLKKSGSCFELSIGYPPSFKNLFDKTLPGIASSFK